MSICSCVWKKSSPPAVLLIVIEDFGFTSATCEQDDRTDNNSGFDILCAEAVRFTHAYTPSTLASPAFASIMTARYPQDHGVRNNGDSYLSAKFETAAELAVKAGYQTAFFGGGPSIWRNSGLNQGFEVFDDNIDLKLHSLYRPASKVVDMFLQWRKDIGRQSYLSVLHFSDPQFLDAPTTSDLGEVRPRGYKSQIDEIDETLGLLFRKLRQDNAWDSTTIIVAGLSGAPSDPRIGELQETNLHSENTRVGLFIKPARKNREGSYNWKIDTNVTLVDVGVTLFELFDAPKPESKLYTTTLKSSFERPDAIWPADRLILVESDWANWKGVGRRRFALRKGPYLYLHDERPQIFNTLTDSVETSPLRPGDLRYEEIRGPFETFVRESGVLPFQKLKPEIYEKVAVGENVWRESAALSPETFTQLKTLSSKYPDDVQLQGWRAMLALRAERWGDLGDAGSRAIQPVWSYVADVYKNVDTVPPANPCLKYFTGKPEETLPTSRECADPELIELAQWNQDPAKQAQALDRFVRLYTESTIDHRISELNYATGHAWDIPLEKPNGPSLVDLILALPSQKRFKQQLSKRLSGENE